MVTRDIQAMHDLRSVRPSVGARHALAEHALAEGAILRTNFITHSDGGYEQSCWKITSRAVDKRGIFTGGYHIRPQQDTSSSISPIGHDALTCPNFACAGQHMLYLCRSVTAGPALAILTNSSPCMLCLMPSAIAEEVVQLKQLCSALRADDGRHGANMVP